MRVRAIHPVGFVSSRLRLSHSFEVLPLVTRCLNPLLKHFLPTVLILFFCSFVALYLGEQVEQTKQELRQAKVDKGYVVAREIAGE